MNNLHKIYKALIISACLSLAFSQIAFAGPTSTTYELKDYTFGAGGTSQSGINSSTYNLFGTAGELDYGKITSSTYGLGGGLTYTLKSNVPAAPTVTNPATNYDRLNVVIDNGGNAADATFAIQISTTSDFSSNVYYAQSDYTLGTTLGSEDFLLYSGGSGVGWGGATGFWVTGLSSNTTYYFRVKARQGNYTESEYGASSNQTTSNASLTFSLDSSTLTFSNLNSVNSYTDNSKTSILTTSTNAYNGYAVYAKETSALTSSVGTISDYAGTNNTPTTWSSGTGFGYTTSDNNLGGTGGITRFSSGTKYAGFVTSSTTAGDIVADDSGPVQNPAISNEQFTITYKVVASNTTPAGTYSNTVMYSIVPTY